MRCKKHLTDVSSTVGVCASCLRNRLDALVAQQSESDPQIRLQLISGNPNPNYCQPKQPIQNHQQQQPPPPLVFPRSVSPYICRRQSEPVQRFYSTPQVNGNKIPPKKPGSKFGLGLISRLFRSKSIIPSSSSNSTVINSHSSTVISCRNKGMSPANEWEYGEHDERDTSESSPARWVNRPSPGRGRSSPARAASIAFCLSPLVRASPSRQWRGGSAAEKSGFSGEIKATGFCKRTSTSANKGNIESSSSNKPHLSAAASFCANRSRKLADFGRVNPNR